jgi:hypothetical protein
MSLSPAKCKILENMLMNERPAKAQDIAKEIGSEFKPVNMHLIGLARAGYAVSPSKGVYVITSKGKEALGLPAVTKECAKQLLAPTSQEQAFHFYFDIDRPLNLYARGLREFARQLETVDSASLEFHLCRGDLEKWFKSLGDAELSKKMALLQAKGLTGERLRAKLRDMIDSRCNSLSALA